LDVLGGRAKFIKAVLGRGATALGHAKTKQKQVVGAEEGKVQASDAVMLWVWRLKEREVRYAFQVGENNGLSETEGS